jgi:integrase
MKPRGAGSVYSRGDVWWIKYYDRTGHARRESSGSKVKNDAEKLLRKRLGEVASGKRHIGADLERTTFEHLEQMIVDDYRANSRRGLARLTIGFKRLGEHFAGWRARAIDYAALQAYRVARKRAGTADATIRWELGAPHRAFKLAERAARAECPPFPTVRVDNARRGFFEPEEWQAIRANLRSEFQDVGDFGYATGWRIMEILTLRWSQVQSGMLRLEPGSTKTGAGRVFPFDEYTELRAVIERRRARRVEIQKAAGCIVPWVFFFHGRGRFHKPGDPLFYTERMRACDAFRREWAEAAKTAGFPGRIPHDFRRTAARNMERAAVPRSVAMALGGWRSESMYRRYAIASEADLRDGVRRLSQSAWGSDEKGRAER